MHAVILASLATEYGSRRKTMLSAKVKRLLVLLRIVLLVTLVRLKLWLNRNWATNHSRKHCSREGWRRGPKEGHRGCGATTSSNPTAALQPSVPVYALQLR
jgi:hypothetical protein